MSTPPHILIVDDQPDNAQLLRKMLMPDGYTLAIVDRGEAALEHVRTHPCDLLLLDVMLPDLDGLEVSRRIKADPALRYIPILLVTAKTDLASIVAGLDAGADDYLSKPVERRELLARVRSALRTRRLQLELLETQKALEAKHQALEASYRALSERTAEKAQLQAEVGELRRQVAGSGRLQDLVGRSAGMRHVFEQIRLVAPSEVTVLVRGETGTGKELVARALHLESPRAAGPFMALNCGAVPEGLLESELFGHEKGAFTGAVARKVGRFERAAGGTLLLDEIGDLPRPMQVKLLRVLQERTYERVGGTQPLTADVRIVAATHKDLEAMVAAGEFRADLYYRLNIFPLQLPPLRERPEDLPALVLHLIGRLAATHGLPTPEITHGAMARLTALPWAGNVRELENTLERALILSAGRPLGEEVLPALPALPSTPAVAGLERSVHRSEGAGASTSEGGDPGFSPDPALPFKTWKHELIAHHERVYIVAALQRFGGNMAAAARETGVDAKTFARKIAEYRIHRREYLGTGSSER